MTKVFYIEDTGLQVFHHKFMCHTCEAITHKVEVGHGTKDDYPKEPDPIPHTKICPTCHGESRYVSVGASKVWIRKDTGETISDIRAHPGACYSDPGGTWDSVTRSKRHGPDGRGLVVICPNGQSWAIDSRASNCDMKTDNRHRCWVRHGSPEEGNLTVDKNGATCGAGAGSIIAGDYHGFLRNGEFVSC